MEGMKDFKKRHQGKIDKTMSAARATYRGGQRVYVGAQKVHRGGQKVVNVMDRAAEYMYGPPPKQAPVKRKKRKKKRSRPKPRKPGYDLFGGPSIFG